MRNMDTDFARLSDLASTMRDLNNRYQRNIETIYEILNTMSQDGSWVGTDANAFFSLKLAEREHINNFGSSLNNFIGSIESSAQNLRSSIDSVRR